jgi:TonB-dependent receptor
MLRRIILTSIVPGFVSLWLSSFAVASMDVHIGGVVKDAQTGEPLPGANVALTGTGFGASTDIYGKYVVRNVPAGSYTIRATYIGYKPVGIAIEVGEGVDVKQDFKLEAVGVQGETVVVTAQAEGQNSAINQQLAAANIVNVVSAARIQELPDANAAESVGRLPGVSILRSGGEGAQVVIRGLAPKYNEVLLDGVKIASSNSGDRSTDLSMVSSEMLNGIEVSKTATADQDADILGGSVNFKLRDAKQEEEQIFRFNLLTQGSYTGLPNAHNKYNNYKYVASIENRFFDSRLGVFAQASLERRNLSSNEFGASYGPNGVHPDEYLTRSINIDDIARDRQRKNGVVALDYMLPQGKISLSNFFSTGVTEAEDRQEFFNIDRGTNTQTFVSRYTKSTLSMITNVLGYEQQVSTFHVNVNLSHSYSETKDPNDWTVNFINSSAGIGQYGDAANLNPQDVVKAANNNLDNTLLQTISTNSSFTNERDLTASVDFETEVGVSEMITSTIKFGGKYRHQTRSYDIDAIDGEAFGYTSGGAIINLLSTKFPWFTSIPGDPLNVLMSPFLDSHFSYGKFLDGNYAMTYPLDYSRLHAMVDFMNANQLPHNITYNHDVGNSTANDYSGKEDISAAYIMATIKVGTLFTITPGVRYQQLKTVYIAAQGLQGPNPYDLYANQLYTATAYHPYWLPNVLVRYKPFEWFDIRLAYSNTLSYPDYASLAPIINVAQTRGTLMWNGFKLDPIRSTNYDVYFSFYDNTIGLFTAGGFLKRITNLIYQKTFTPATSAQLTEYYPDWVPNKTPIAGIAVSTYINNPYRIDDYGMELDWQTHFWYLPRPLDGLVMNVNYTHIFSKADYPFQYVNTSVRPTKYIDSSYTAPLLYQPDNILNLSIGYDYKGFSIRASRIYSDKIFTGPNSWSQLRTYTSAYDRWDIAVKQDLPLPGLQLFGAWNNVNGVNDVSVITAPTGVPAQQQNYDYTLEVGLRYQL